MSSTLVITLATLGVLLWLIATVRERFKNVAAGSIWKLVQNFLQFKESGMVPANDSPSPAPTVDVITIDALERELGIEPDHYLCDRISRINEALMARRDKQASKKRGGTQ